MKILTGRNVQDFTDAAKLAFDEARVGDMSVDIIDVFASVADIDRISSDADRSIGTTIRNRYGGKATWRAERWFVPLPKLHYDGKDVPRLIIVVTTYLVATAAVRTTGDSRWITLVGVVGGRPETLTIPMVFLHAVLEEDLARFAVVARDANWITWEVPGAKPVRLPSAFIDQLTAIFRRKSVVTWLLEFGAQGRYVAPLAMGNLFGLAFRDSSSPEPMSRQLVKVDDLLSALESMAYKLGEAREMVNRAAPYLRADITLEEAIRITLQVAQGGHQQ